MKIVETTLDSVLLIEPNVYRDDRGAFLETYQQERYSQAGLPARFAQDNISVSKKNVLRGLHFQNPHPQGKLVQVLSGAVFDVAVDLRRDSPSFGQWFAAELSEHNRRQLWVPEGFAHGFYTLQPDTIFLYKCTAPYVADADRCIRWDDPALGIEWPAAAPFLSEKDVAAPCLSDYQPSQLF